MNGAVPNRYGRWSGVGHSYSVHYAAFGVSNGPAAGQVPGR